MPYIAINENGKFDKSFEWPKKPKAGDLFRYQLDGEVTKIYVVTQVGPPPSGLSGRVSYQITHQVQTTRSGDQTLVPLVQIEHID